MAPEKRVIAALVLAAPYRPDPLPVPLTLLPVPLMPSSQLRFDMARPDQSGRISVRGLLADLAWTPTIRLDLAITAGTLIFTVGVPGQHPVAESGTITVPSTARRLTGCLPGQPVLLAAAPDQDLLVVIPSAIVDGWVRRHFTDLAGPTR